MRRATGLAQAEVAVAEDEVANRVAHRRGPVAAAAGPRWNTTCPCRACSVATSCSAAGVAVTCNGGAAADAAMSVAGVPADLQWTGVRAAAVG